MKKILLPFIFTLFLLLTACNNDQEILAFFDEWDDTTNIMLQKIEAGDIDGARLVFDAHKENLKSGWRKIPRSRSGGNGKIYMSSAVKKRYDGSFSQNINAITNTFITFENKFGKDKTKVEKLKILDTEYREIFR
ncbi:MAG TPA: hypothetical protein PKY82_11400 [Pyrinomonadaceae bacterium]|nr:hypothetical protein [Pyrinomonadaceae bacterium]